MISHSPAMHRFAAMTMGATLILLIAGGLVTSTDSGLAVPDWPLSYGTLFPPMVGGIRFEHTHRLIAGVVALMIWALAVWLWRAQARRWVQWLGTSAAVAVLVQAVLGGVTVLWGLPWLVSVAHACLAQLVFCALACVMLGTSPKWEALPAASVPRSGALRALAWVATATVLGQLLLGALLRHGGGWAMMPHMIGALVVLLLAVLAVVWTRRIAGVPASPRRVATVFAGMVAAQLLLGPAALFHLDHPLVTMAHQVVGALVLMHACLLAVMMQRVAQ
jgi:cytochrome c oxidase assembly protein subunit 15